MVIDGLFQKKWQTVLLLLELLHSLEKFYPRHKLDLDYSVCVSSVCKFCFSLKPTQFLAQFMSKHDVGRNCLFIFRSELPHLVNLWSSSSSCGIQ